VSVEHYRRQDDGSWNVANSPSLPPSSISHPFSAACASPTFTSG
jgi:hypothetical protein